MTIKNTPDNYGSIAKWIHWITALLFLAAYASVYYRHWLPEDGTSGNWTALQLHLSIGVSVGVLVILRIIWRLMNITPHPEPGTRLEHLAAKLGHYALYFIMIAAPLTGYMGTGVDTDYFFLFNIPQFESTSLYTVLVTDGLGISFDAFEEVVDFIHKGLLGEFLVWILILGHAAAALYHHYAKGDRTLLKMTTGK